MIRRARFAVACVALVAAVAPSARAEATYEQPVWFEWGRAQLEVLIVPAHHGQLFNSGGLFGGQAPVEEAHPYLNSYTRAMEHAVKDYYRAIDDYGSAELRAGLRIRYWVLGRDIVPPDAMTGIDIIVGADENKTFILGLAARLTGRACLALNSMSFTASMNYNDMFNIAAHEYGHCLGLGHVNEAAGQGNLLALRQDTMNGRYAHTPGGTGTPRHCVSSLNVRGLEEVHHEVLGTGTGGAATIPTSSYTRPTTC